MRILTGSYATAVAYAWIIAPLMILTFTRIHNTRRQQNRAFIPIWIFVGAYLAAWSVFGLLAYGSTIELEKLENQSEWLMTNAARIGGGLLVVAGIYKFLPIRNTYLNKW